MIRLIMGPMFCGKSTELLRLVRRSTIAGKTCVVIKHAKDTRYSPERVCTHDDQTHDAFTCGDRLMCIHSNMRSFDVVGIDEGQFFHDLQPFCDALANDGKLVIVSALDGDFQRNPFPSVAQLIPHAEVVTKLHAVCMVCGHSAAFTQRTTADERVEVVGGAEMYRATCRRCHCALPPGSTQCSKSASIDTSGCDTDSALYTDTDAGM